MVHLMNSYFSACSFLGGEVGGLDVSLLGSSDFP